MRLSNTTRLLALTGALLCATAALAQHGGGPPGGGGGMGGGGLGGGRMNGGMGSPRGIGGGMGSRGSMDRGDARGDRDSNVPFRPTGPQLGLPGRWWDEHKTIKSLGLRSDQKQRMDDVFSTNKPALVTALSNLQREQNNLASMSKQDRQDETKVFAAINRVEAARGDLAKEIAHYQLQIRQQLDPDQLTRLDEAIASQH